MLNINCCLCFEKAFFSTNESNKVMATDTPCFATDTPYVCYRYTLSEWICRKYVALITFISIIIKSYHQAVHRLGLSIHLSLRIIKLSLASGSSNCQVTVRCDGVEVTASKIVRVCHDDQRTQNSLWVSILGFCTGFEYIIIMIQ